jgi:hypothetical protein
MNEDLVHVSVARRVTESRTSRDNQSFFVVGGQKLSLITFGLLLRD